MTKEKDMDLDTLKDLYPTIKDYHDRCWVGFLISSLQRRTQC